MSVQVQVQSKKLTRYLEMSANLPQDRAATEQVVSGYQRVVGKELLANRFTRHREMFCVRFLNVLRNGFTRYLEICFCIHSAKHMIILCVYWPVSAY